MRAFSAFCLTYGFHSMCRFMDARVKSGHDAAVWCADYFRTQMMRVTEAFAASTPGVPEAGAT
jgi:hypothetical protein